MPRYHWATIADWAALALAWAALALACVSGCSPRTPPPEDPRTGVVVLRGTAGYAARSALPPSAVLVVQVTESAGPGASTGEGQRVIAQRRIPVNGRQVPLAFEAPIPAALIDPERRYEASCLIETEGRVIWSSGRPEPVLTLGFPSVADFVLTAQAPAP